jgi:homoserine O-acetyltransferase
MSVDPFSSSDGVRTARSLFHAQFIELTGPTRLERGDTLAHVRMAYETYGTLNLAGDNAVLICHALSGDSHVARHDAEDDPGWWDLTVGPGEAIDTNKYFVICPNILGGCRGTTGPKSIDPATGRPYGAAFPVITVGDIVEVQRRLVDELGIRRLKAVVGASLGGFMALTWAERHGDRVEAVIAIATSARLTSQALAFDIVGRNAILRDPGYRGGQYYDRDDPPVVGLAIARMLGHITYLSRDAMTQKFGVDRLNARDVNSAFETRFSVGSYLAYQGERFVERFDANSYITLSTAMDLFDLGATREQIATRLHASPCRWLLLSFSSDWLFPPFQSCEIVDALLSQSARVSYCEVRSDCGHDAFLLPDERPLYGGMIAAFLGPETTGSAADDGDTSPHPPFSIFHERRLDYETILKLIPVGASVLDIGCGSGGLLSRLRLRGHNRLLGVERDERLVLATLARGHDVIHADVDQGLSAFADRQFDVVVLSQTLQAVTQVELVLNEILRVGSLCIVSFPNLAYGPRRARLAVEGRSPHGGPELGQSWYNTPNLRFLTIADFQDYCRVHGVHIHKMVAVDTAAGQEVTDDLNLNADTAVFAIRR